jgi:hypothetical protein
LPFLALRLIPPSLRGFGFAATSLNVVGGALMSTPSTALNFDLSIPCAFHAPMIAAKGDCATCQNRQNAPSATPKCSKFLLFLRFRFSLVTTPSLQLVRCRSRFWLVAVASAGIWNCFVHGKPESAIVIPDHGVNLWIIQHVQRNRTAFCCYQGSPLPERFTLNLRQVVDVSKRLLALST